MKKIICMLIIAACGSAVAQTKTLVTTNGEKVIYPPLTRNELTSVGNTITSDVNGVPSSTTTINSVSNSLNGSDLTTTVNGINSAPIDLSFLVHEPWKIMGSTLPATLNTQNIFQTGKVGIGAGNPSFTEMFQVHGKSIFTDFTPGAVKIVDGTQGLGKVLTSDATGLATWQNNGVYILDGKVYHDATIDFVASGGSNCMESYIDLPQGSWAVNLGFLLNPRKGRSVAESNTTYTARLGLSSSRDVIARDGFNIKGSHLVLASASIGTKAPKYPLFANGVIRLEVTQPNVRLYLWNMQSVGGTNGGGEAIGSFATNAENYIYAIKVN